MIPNLINIPTGISEIRRDEHELACMYCLCDPYAYGLNLLIYETSVQMKHTTDKVTTSDRLLISKQSNVSLIH